MISSPSLVLGVAVMVAIKWFVFLGLFGLIFGILGIVKLHKEEKANSLGISYTVLLGIIFLLGII
jgi:hypothetical protein